MTTLPMTARDILIALADEYQNNYLSPERFAECNGLRVSEAQELITLSQSVRAKDHPDA